ncbi:MAG: prepilin-type N-terminal cleavage/methylation domain-containing protein [Planctomycetota bacterium]|jgi:general secretion pathway protein G
MKAKSGFTLVEILIVVVVLGILAAVVIPQFTDASTQAKESSLLSNLQSIRSQIELYKIQHSDALPGAGGATFVQAMVGKTDVDGAVDASGAYGPYIQSIPDNPFNDSNTVTTGTGTPGGDSGGWYFNTSNGNFNADDSNDHAAW